MINAPLADNEREMLDKLMAAIRERFADLLVEARLFGSKARGDSDPESDLDLWLLFQRELTREEKEALLDIVVPLDVAYDVWTQTVIDTLARWEMPAYRHGGFARAIREEGVAL